MDNNEFTFDKFMDRILLEEDAAKESTRRELDEEEEDDPRRRLMERYTERANNCIRYVRK